MTVDLNVPAGTRLHLLGGEIHPNPTGRDELVWTVAVFTQAVAGMVWVRGHVCGGPEPDCAAGWCFEARVAVHAIRANLAGAR
ncbi:MULTISPECIES: hypothetical protein [unclassified Micromonospora]|uniref:hypothetical protein n=1 Tax=unclassified Micromonospora TaxID=2617518 RepID=UPI003319480E